MKKLFVIIALAFSTLVQAQEEIVLWVGITPGGPMDQIARHVQNAIQPIVTHGVNVLYKPGAGGVLAMSKFAQNHQSNKIDLLVANEQILIHKYLTKKLSDKDFKELEPVAYIGQAPFMLVSNTKLGPKDFPKLLPSQSLTNGVAGVGTFSHLIHVLLEKQMVTSFTAVQYQGTAKILIDLVGGHISTAIVFPGSVISHLSANQLTPLAVSGNRRWNRMLLVPTFQELGLEVPAGSFWAIFIRAGSVHKEKIQKILYQGLESPASKDTLINKLYLTLHSESDLTKWWAQNNNYYRNLSSRYDFRSMEVD